MAKWITGSSLALLGLGGCTNLTPVGLDVCGNRVLETAAGEDCDGEAGCGAPNTTHACRYVCSAPPDCPVGFGCGVDGVCRRPVGELVTIAGQTTLTARDLLVGDLNADGCAEVVVTSSRQTSIHAFASNHAEACVASEQALEEGRPDPSSANLPQPELVDLTANDGRSWLSLLTANHGLYGDGLSLYFTNGNPTLFPVLFPLFPRGGSSPRQLRVRVKGGKNAILFFGQPSEETAADVVLFLDPQTKTEVFKGAIPGGMYGIAAIGAADVEDDAALDVDRCDEVFVAREGGTAISFYRLCLADGSYGFYPMSSGTIWLQDGATVRSTSATILAADMNGDGHQDIVANASDEQLHVAFGLGDGRFHSAPPPAPVPDGKAGIAMVENVKEIAGKDRIFVAGEFDSTHPGVDLVGIPCPTVDPFSSPTCGPVGGGCEAVVGDIDMDGDDDIVSTEGQAVDLGIRRQVGGGGFHVSYLRTSCPPHYLDIGDLDDDGVRDIAFFDQTSKGPQENAMSLSIAYGNALAAPSAPTKSGRFDEAAGLSIVRFGAQFGGEQLALSRAIDMGKSGSAFGVAEVGNQRTVVAPYYFQSSTSGHEPLEKLSIVAQAAGDFMKDSGGTIRPAVAVVTRDGANATALRIVDSSADGSSLRASSKTSAPSIACSECMLAAVPQGTGQQDMLAVLGDKALVLYQAGDDGFVMGSEIASQYTFRSVLAGTNPPKYAPRPIVGTIDEDDLVDVLALATTGELVAFFGRADGLFDEQVLVAAVQCGNGSSTCGNLSAARIDADGDGMLDLAIAGPGLFEVYAVTTSGAARTLTPLSVSFGVAAPLDTADFTALGAADVDADGVTDLVLMPNGNFFSVLRGRPERE